MFMIQQTWEATNMTKLAPQQHLELIPKAHGTPQRHGPQQLGRSFQKLSQRYGKGSTGKNRTSGNSTQNHENIWTKQEVPPFLHYNISLSPVWDYRLPILHSADLGLYTMYRALRVPTGFFFANEVSMRDRHSW
jgi:hypothetical protein